MKCTFIFICIGCALLQSALAAEPDAALSAGRRLQRSEHPATGPSTASALSLDDVLREVLASNPSLKAARANWEALKQRVPQARAWDDLRSEFTTVAGRFVSIPPDSMADQRLSLQQPIPLSGRNRLRAQSAEAEAAFAFADLHRRELDLAEKAKAAFYELAGTVQQLRIVDANLGLLREFAEVSRAKYQAGLKPQSDVLTAETDASKLEESRYDVLRQISEAQSRLNVLMNRPAQSPLPSVEVLAVDLTNAAAPHLELERLQSLALTNRPELLMARKKIEAAAARLAAAKREWVPDPSLMVEATRYNASSRIPSEVAAGVAINIPWLNRAKYRAAIEEANQMKISAEFELEAAEKNTLALVRDALKKTETMHHHFELFRDRILVLARQNAAAARAAYEANQTSFLNLIDAQRTLQESEAMYWTHLTDYLTSLAELESIIGVNPETAHHSQTISKP